jgi:hypothetical protein
LGRGSLIPSALKERGIIMNLEKGRKLVEFGKEVMRKLELDDGLKLVEDLAQAELNEEKRIGLSLSALGLMINSIGLRKLECQMQQADVFDILEFLNIGINAHRFLDVTADFLMKDLEEKGKVKEFEKFKKVMMGGGLKWD